MTLYMIRGDKVSALTAAPAKTPKDALIVHSATEIESSNLPVSQLVELWNALPKAKPVIKFKDRPTAARRLWAAFEQLPLTPAKTVRSPKMPAASKQDKVIAILQRPGGATVDEIADATQWQRHTIRGMISGALKKKLGLSVISEKTERGRVYRIEGAIQLVA